MMNEQRTKRDWWQKGRGFDLWSIPHFLFGILMGISPFLIGISSYSALVLTIVCALLWELFEKLFHIKESMQNILLDIILSVVAFLLTSSILQSYSLHPDDLAVVATAVAALFIFTNISGWLAYRRRNRDFR